MGNKKIAENGERGTSKQTSIKSDTDQCKGHARGSLANSGLNSMLQRRHSASERTVSQGGMHQKQVPQQQQQQHQQQQHHTPTPNSRVCTLDIVVAVHDFNYPPASATNKLSFQRGDTVYVLAKSASGWWDGLSIADTDNKVIRGWFPYNHVRLLRENVSCNFRTVSSVSNKSSRRTSIHKSSLRNNGAPPMGAPAAAASHLDVPAEQAISNTGRSATLLSLPLPVSNKSRRGSYPYFRRGSFFSNHSNQSKNSAKRSSIVLNSNSNFTNVKYDDLSTIDPLDKTEGTPESAPSSRENDTCPSQGDSPSGSVPSSVPPSLSKTMSHQRDTVTTKREQINILSLEEVEMIINSFHTNVSPTWTPIPIVSATQGPGDKLIYYNKELDIYCSEFPLVSTTESKMNNKSSDDPEESLEQTSEDEGQIPGKKMGTSMELVFPPNDHLVDLRARNIAESIVDKTRSSEEATDGTEEEEEKRHSVASTAKPKGKPSVTGTQDYKSNHSHSQTFYRQAILSKQDLFYQHSKDIRTWIELEDLTFHYTRLAHDMFIRNDRMNFSKFFEMLSNMVTYLQLSCRLIHNQIKLKNSNKSVKKLLKGMISSLAKININAILYFTNGPRWNANDTGDGNAAQRTSSQNESRYFQAWLPEFGHDDNYVHNDTMLNLNEESKAPDSGMKRNVSTSTTDTLIPARNTETFDSLYNGDPRGVPTSQRTSINRGLSYSSANGPDKPAKIQALPEKVINVRGIFENIDHEFVKFMKDVHTLYHILQTTVLHNNEFQFLPQVLPRFFKGSFNGGSWTNPFAKFIFPSDVVQRPDTATNLSVGDSNSAIPKSFDATTAPSSNTGVPLKMTNAISLAAGVNVPTDMVLDGDISSASSTRSRPFQSISSTSNRPSHPRTFSRFKNFKRKSKYPLNNDTLNTMQKIANQIFEDFNTKNNPLPNYDIRRSVRNLELNSKTYDQINQNTILIEILENLDLTIFLNLKRLIKTTPNSLDSESEEFLKHAMSSISGVLSEFYNIKQCFHNILVRLIMSAQHTTLNDPYVFTSMRPNHQIDFNEPILLEKITLNKNLTKLEKKSRKMYAYLVKEDVEFNNVDFLDMSKDFCVSSEKYVEIAKVSCLIMEQLIEERENLLNYAARMMKNDLTTELLKGEQDLWFDYNSESDSDDFLLGDKEGDESSTGHDAGSDGTVSNTRKKMNIVRHKRQHNSDVPWFLQTEHDYDLIYDSRGQIKGGPKEALMEHLTSHELIDPSFNVAMLISFRSIMSTRDFLYALVYRYNLYPPEGLSYDEYNTWVEEKLTPIKCRVINIMKTFLQQYWCVHYYEPGLSSLESFANLAISEKIPGSDELLLRMKENLVESCLRTAKKTSSDNSSSDVSENKKRSESSSGSLGSSLIRLKKMKLLGTDPYIYATQLTILEHELYLRISMFECLDRAWGNKYCNMGGSANISHFITNANALTNYVSYSIVRQTEVKRRAHYIQFFITVAEHCKELNNFSSMTAIISALYSSPVYRLKRTWKLLAREIRDTLSNLNSLMDSKRNFAKYRSQLRSVKNVACVPFFGVYLSDLTFTSAGNPDFLHKNENIINFGKRVKVVDIIEEILSFKRVHYKLKRFDEVRTIIEASLEEVPHIEIQYQLSLEIEPRSNHAANSNPLDVVFK
ncbi:Ras family guanine nucleotide exchange factor CDC25 KNAG_0J02750 [Huiozyma naganishii CBS 8797]|uniref:Cell division control protein 25 n=1 Tax=Huiozyma naganishii (strain ATCC MYA-139 / BCRC 22969 / CBS 8797 / KCTC 17520 / NBRC 10181 / NCYC 3082 / Yp74L-3) TaxID=1071383 RepID=J7S9X6_HUIN7|nr:hypothetical protein KNAG_0J02750 [Kazachstania naganishii CBS 8797]CCK72354.1 hypothetical protein KNAG_0J02750 [Kazachstania naganishii CBS 8797]